MFFTHISQLMTQGVDLTIVIRRKENELIVSTLPKSNGLKDEAQHHIVPLTLTGTAAELDAGFLQAIARPVQRAVGLIANLEQFEQQAAKASANSKATKEAQTKECKEAKEKQERYDKFIKKADELLAAKSYNEALINLQQARLHATQQNLKTVDDKIAAVKAQLNQGSLFAMEEVPPTQPQTPQQIQSAQSNMWAPQPTVPQMPQQTIPAAPASRFEDDHTYPAAAGQTFDPAYCRPDEYAAYPDFPANMQAPSCNHTHNPQIF